MLQLRRKGRRIGFVPTMGALHDGHLSLILYARRESDIVVAGIFVNPLQFGPKEDFKKYPRPKAEDERLLKKEGVDYLFHPEVSGMYPKGKPLVFVDVDPSLVNVLCGEFRPGHFRGVATVVAKLFEIVKPTDVFFGAKDYQQGVVVRRLIEDLNMDIRFHLCPTVREKDGLAMSSRNRYLSAKERRRAREISATLFWLRDQILYARKESDSLKKAALRRLRKAVDRIDYLEIVDPETLQPLTRFQSKRVIATACLVGKTRLIDNVIIDPLFPKKIHKKEGSS